MTTQSPELVSDRKLTIISVVLLLGAITTILDTTIVNVALDHLHTVFHASVADTQWVASGYLLALGGVIPLTGWASERFGSKQVWMFAVALFMIGSVLCGLSWSLPSLIAFRVLQGIGGGMVLPITITILTQAAGPARLGRAIAAIAVPAQLGPILGPVVGGAIIDSIAWNWLFFVNVPICLAALVLAPRILPASGHDRIHKPDLPGFALLTPGLIAIAYGISVASQKGGFSSPSVWATIIGGFLFIAAFALYSVRTRRAPLVDVRLFGRRSFGFASIVTFIAGFSTYAVMFLLPQFYQVVRGDSAFATGLLLIPQGLGTILFVLVSKRLAARVPTRLIVVGGIILTMVSMIPFLFAPASGSDLLLLCAQLVQGFGAGAVMLTITTLAFVDLARPEIPRASAAFSIVQRVGAPFGVTVIAVLLQGYLSRAVLSATHVADSFGATFWWVLAFSTIPLIFAFFLPSAAAKTGTGNPGSGTGTETTGSGSENAGESSEAALS